jgi:hypothetical protein
MKNVVKLNLTENNDPAAEPLPQVQVVSGTGSTKRTLSVEELSTPK